MSERGPSIYFHVGPPKTGTTFLQQVLWAHRPVLRAADITLPGGPPSDHFHAALDLRQMDFGGYHNPRTEGAWPRLIARAKTVATAKALISHEVFAGADDEQIARLMRDCHPASVEVVYGARDLARQLPSIWQESLKHRRTKTYSEFLTTVLRPVRSGRQQPGIWQTHHAALALERWATHLPAERIHVVTLPPRDAPREVLWRRFCAVLGVAAPERFDLDVARPNPSLDVVHAELLRRLNGVLASDLPWPEYARIVKRRFNQLADVQATRRQFVVPVKHRRRVLELTEGGQGRCRRRRLPRRR